MLAPGDRPDLLDAIDTDEVFRLAYELAAWGLRNGECDVHDAVDWVLDHPHEDQLPRGSRGRLNPTLHHITKGAEAAVEKYEPWAYKAEFDPEVLHELAARIDGSGVTHERYLLGVIALCHKFETLTPVITGPLLAGVVGVNNSTAGEVLKAWSSTMAYGFFTAVAYDGIKGHGRVWTVDPDWTPTSKPKHKPGCNRSQARCRCFGDLSQTTGSIFTAAKDRSAKVRHPGRNIAAEFAEWVKPMKPGHRLTVAEVAKHLGVTRASATKLLRAQQGELLDEATAPGRHRTRRDPVTRELRQVRVGETWFRAQPKYGDDMSDETAERLGLI